MSPRVTDFKSHHNTTSQTRCYVDYYTSLYIYSGCSSVKLHNFKITVCKRFFY